MSQYFFNPLVLQAARNRYRDRLEEMDRVLFLDGGRSLLEAQMSVEEADRILEEALENRLHQGTVSGNLVAFARAFSGGKLNPDFGEPIRKMIVSLDDHHALLENGIRSYFRKATAAAVMTVLMIGAAVLLACGPARAAGTSGGNTVETQPGSIIAALCAAAAGAAGITALSARKGKKRRKKTANAAKTLPEKLCGEKEAGEVLQLIHCLADIYRNERA